MTIGSCAFLHVSPYLPADSRLKAMAQPMTSCMSEPMIASSTISHKMIRGTWRPRANQPLSSYRSHDTG